jgi:hypothetical protein
MTAKDTVLEHAPRWSEEQAARALLAAEGRRSVDQERRLSEHRALMERAAALRARQPEVVDAAALVREVRDALEQRAS